MADVPRFGTDGIRGPFGKPPLDRVTLRRLGAALGEHLASQRPGVPVLLAGDTRSSTPDICRWLAEGLAAANRPYRYGGVLPTPAVARLVRAFDLPSGIAVSASHNPYPDNGVKLIAADGAKWDLDAERTIELALEEPGQPLATPEVELTPDNSLAESYLDRLTREVLDGESLRGLRVTLDCANGAASDLAPRLFRRLGAEVETLGNRPDGSNINRDCGSTSPETMAARTTESGCDIGFAFDGDADRVILADETGRVRDGDSILYLLARHLREEALLEPPRIVATTMSNIGLELALEREGIEIARCDVGDRFVVDTLRKESLLLGGEQSGHIVHLGLGPTGDGLQTALLVARARLAGGRPLSALLREFVTFPQVLRNVPVATKPDFLEVPSIQREAAEVDSALEGRGRLLLRYSGTEPLARIMIEGQDQDEIEAFAERLAGVIDEEIGIGR
jgi:phosphoglucosamine mutase